MTNPAINTVIAIHKNAGILLNLNTSLNLRFVFSKPIIIGTKKDAMLPINDKTIITNETSEKLKINFNTPDITPIHS